MPHVIERNMEDTQTKKLEAIHEVVIKKEPLDEEDGLLVRHTQTPQPENADTDLRAVQIHVKEEYPPVYGLLKDTYIKQEQTNLHEESIASGKNIKTEDVAGQTSSTPLDNTIETPMTDAAGADRHFFSSLPVSANPAVKESPFPVALFQHERTRSNKEVTVREYIQGNTSSSQEITSDNVTAEHRVNGDNGTHRCSICGYRSAYKSHLESHMKRHTGEKPYQCSVCDFRSAYIGPLLSHKKTHYVVKKYKCSVCDYCPVNKSNLVTHMRKHTGEKPYKCSLCDYSAAHKTHLVRHTRTHTGEKPYPCSSCNFRSADKSTLVRHMRTHTDEKPFKCSSCNYCSALKSTLRRHTEAFHTGEKSYQCESCYCSFAKKKKLIKHTKIHN